MDWTLRPEQAEAKDKILSAWEAGDPVIITAPIRWGKTHLSLAVMHLFKSIFVALTPPPKMDYYMENYFVVETFDTSPIHTVYDPPWLMTRYSSDMDRLLKHGSLPAPYHARLRDGGAVVIDEPFFMERSEGIFHAMRKHTHRILAIGSHGHVSWSATDAVFLNY